MLLHRLLDLLGRLRVREAGRPAFWAPPLERRGAQIAAEDYAARHLIEHTLDRKAGLRRLAPRSPEAAQRYRELLTYEMNALQEVTKLLSSTAGEADLGDVAAETAEEIERLRIEVAWCDELLEAWAKRPT